MLWYALQVREAIDAAPLSIDKAISHKLLDGAAYRYRLNIAYSLSTNFNDVCPLKTLLLQ